MISSLSSGKTLLTRRADPIEDPSLHSSSFGRSLSQNDAGTSDNMHDSVEVEDQDTTKPNNGSSYKLTISNIETMFKKSHRSTMGARATDSTYETKELSGSMVILERVRELAWSGVPPYMCPTIWRLLLILAQVENYCLDFLLIYMQKSVALY
ncbi:uncharacterized protein LOC123208398 [Mangifera indica]|uniref:uncharacterized protein LOC123208398 n=1 Tax=Mangifera indica TaxID=29780 RepID=UPI001CFBB63E|nr:uncharacterized protein LOC123208398 [Mangifera indica]